jgi:hypothetical protein
MLSKSIPKTLTMPEWVSHPFRPPSRNYLGVVTVVEVDCVCGGGGVAGVSVVVVVEDVLCGVVGGGVAGVSVVVVVEDVLCGVGGGGVGGGCVVVVVDCVLWEATGSGVAGCGGVAGACVVVVLDCVVACAIAGSDSASTTSDPKTTADSVVSFIRFSLCCPECDT